MTKLYSTFDPASLGANMGLEQANTIVVTTGIASINRMAKCLYPKSSSQWFAEFAFWGDEPLTGRVSVGVAKASSALTEYVGEDAASWGYRAGDGAIYNNGSSVDSVTTAVSGDIIGVLVNVGDGTAATITWFLNDIPLSTQSLPDDGPWYLAATVSTSSSDNLQCWINTGQRDFEYPVAGVDGWFNLTAQVPAILAATEDYASPADDPVPNQIWDGTIADEGVEIVSELKFWVDGDVRSARGSAASVTLVHDGFYDWTVTTDTRDAPISLQALEQGDSYDNATNIAVMVVDDIRVVDQNTIRITMASSMALLDVPLQTKIFPPSANEVVAGKSWPVMLGAVRSATPVLVDPVTRTYALSDRGIVAVGYVRDKGAPLDPLASDPGWVIGDDYRTIVLETEPIGKLTADVSSIGGEVPVTISDDIWDGYANPFTDNAGAPANFDVQSNATYVSGDRCRLTAPSLSGTAFISLSTASCIGGRSYRYRVDLATVPGTHTYGIPTVSLATSTGLPIVAWTAAGVYSGVFTAPYTFTPRLILQDALTASSSLINEVYILEIPDDYDPAVIQPITLTDFVREIIEVRAKRLNDSWSLADTTEIDAVGYAGIGFYDTGSITVRQAIESVMSSWTACAWTDSSGVLRFSRLISPSEKASSGDITEDDLLSEIICKPDLAPGLSNQMQCRKNWTVLNDTDFVSDYITVPGEVRRALSQPFQNIVSSAVPLASMYASAVYGEPIGVLLDDPADAQAEIDRICTYYSVPRFFYEFTVPAEFALELGQVWTVTNSRYGLESGRDLMVCKTIVRPIDGSITVTLRG